MKRKGIVLVLVIMIWFSQVSVLDTQEEGGPLCAITGNMYIDLPELIREWYVIGMMDSIYVVLDAFEPEYYQRYKDKMEGMITSQIRKILDKYLEENPEMLHYCAAVCLLYAIDEVIYE